MKIIIKNGNIVTFDDKGSCSEHARNMKALVTLVKGYAVTLGNISDSIFDQSEPMKEDTEKTLMRRKLKNIENTLHIADKQLKKDAAERKARTAG